MFIRRAILSCLPVALISSVPTAAIASDAGPEPVASISGVTAPPARGSVPVGTATYPVPARATFVDAARGNDNASGTINAPLKTVSRALDRTAAGGTIVLREGTYHERVFIGQAVTVQAYPGEAVWFDGTQPLTSWTERNGVWETAFTQRFDRRTPGSDDAFVGPQNPLAAYPEMVFVDGRRLYQVESTPRGDQFVVDQASGKVFLGVDPRGKDVRITTFTQALVVGSPDVTLRGFGVRRFANSVQTYGVVYVARPRTLVENVVVEDVATTGITLDSDGRTGSGRLDQVTVRRAGMLGIHGRWADGASITNSVVTESNFERFNNTPTSAGIKICQTRGITIDNNRVSNSRMATGIWLDEAVVGFRITRNQVGGNGDTGISTELSSSGTISSNHVVGHQQGIVLYNTEKTLVSHNTMGYNTMSDLHMIQDWRRQNRAASMGHDSRYAMGDPTNTWLLRDITVRNNLFGGDGNQKSLFQVYVMDRNTNRSADTMNIQFAGNAFTPKRTDNDPIAVAWGNGDNRSTRNFDSIQDFQRTIGRPANNFTLSTSEFSSGMDEARWNQAAVPLTRDHATPIGAPAGLRAIGSLTG